MQTSHKLELVRINITGCEKEEEEMNEKKFNFTDFYDKLQ